MPVLPLAIAFGGLDHGVADTVFYTADGILAFQLGDHPGGGAFGDSIQLNQRGMTDQVGDTCCNFHGFSPAKELILTIGCCRQRKLCAQRKGL
jgi:hypothetical protein